MKKTYMEPCMIVEDFRVDEMVAANCVFVPEQLNPVTQMSAFKPACDSGEGMTPEQGTAYGSMSDGYEEYDHDGDAMTPPLNLFTSGYHAQTTNGGEYICSSDPFELGITLTVDSYCNPSQGGDTPLINS